MSKYFKQYTLITKEKILLNMDRIESVKDATNPQTGASYARLRMVSGDTYALSDSYKTFVENFNGYLNND